MTAPCLSFQSAGYHSKSPQGLPFLHSAELWICLGRCTKVDGKKVSFFLSPLRIKFLKMTKKCIQIFHLTLCMAMRKLAESRKGLPVRFLSLRLLRHKSEFFFFPYRLRRVGCPDKPIKLLYFKIKNQEVRGQLRYAYIEKCHSLAQLSVFMSLDFQPVTRYTFLSPHLFSCKVY